VKKLPPHGANQRIGLFGGSFNPAHEGHRQVALYALKHLRLDWVWWLVSPQNPLKETKETADYAKRLAFTKLVAKHPKFIVCDFEKQIASRTTVNTLRAVKQLSRQTKFVWIMGADSLANLHHWHHWTEIVEMAGMAVLARPGYSIRALGSKAALRYRNKRKAVGVLANKRPPAWTFISMPLRNESSTAIRNRSKTQL
jgi:nicotinate-nucleotide adenylyltransferase